MYIPNDTPIPREFFYLFLKKAPSKVSLIYHKRLYQTQKKTEMEKPRSKKKNKPMKSKGRTKTTNNPTKSEWQP